MLTESRTINVLGTNIKIIFREEKQDPQLEDMGGYFDSSENLIVVKIPEKDTYRVDSTFDYGKFKFIRRD